MNRKVVAKAVNKLTINKTVRLIDNNYNDALLAIFYSVEMTSKPLRIGKDDFVFFRDRFQFI